MTEQLGEHPHVPEAPSPLSADLPHRAADDSEEVYYEGHPLLRGAIGRNILWMLGGLVLIIIAIAQFRYAHAMHLAPAHASHIQFWILIVLALVGFGMTCYPPLRAMTLIFKVTNYRIDYERGIFAKDIDTLELWHVEDIHYHQTVRNRLLGIGTITVLSHDPTTPTLVLHALPNSRYLFEQLKQRIIAVKRQRGVLKLDSGM